MRCCSKEKISGKPSKMNKDISHVCPSKLSKRELQDLYFTVMQANVELKQTINQQNEKIKNQGTKLQRMLATQRAYMGSEKRDCCATVKAIVQEQKHIIVDLKDYNENLKEQLKNLNMKLCSTKQFLKRGVPKEREITKHNCLGRSKQSPRIDSAKNSSTSALNSNISEHLAMEKKSVSCQHLDNLHLDSGRKPKDGSKNDTVAMRVDVRNKPCDQNKCRTKIEELQQKIANLQKELLKTHEEYAKRIENLEKEVLEQRSDNVRVRTEKAIWEHNMAAMTNETNGIKKKLAESEFNREQLSAKLDIEKGKVAELETQVKAANMTNGAVKAIEERFAESNKQKDEKRNSNTSARSTIFGPFDSTNKSHKSRVSQDSTIKSVNINENSKENSDVKNTNTVENKKCCEHEKCPETLANNLIEDSPTLPNPFKLVDVSNELDTSRGPETGKRCCNPTCPAKLRRQDLQNKVQIKECSGESSSYSGSHRIPSPNKSEAQSQNRQCTEIFQNQTNENSGENSNAARRDSVLSHYGNAENRRDSVSSRKENVGENNNIAGKKVHLSECKCIKEECEDVSMGDTQVGSPNETSGFSYQNKGRGNHPYYTSKLAENRIVADKIPIDYTTEYRSQYTDPNTASTGFQPAPMSPNKGDGSPVMSELVNKSNESSCICSGQCRCANSERSMRGETAVAMFSPSHGGQSSPLSTEEQTLLQKFLSLFLPGLLSPGEATTNRPLAETADSQSAADTSAKTGDDSGFAEANRSAASEKEKWLARANQDLMNRVAELQAQLDQLKVHVLSRRGTYTVLKDGTVQRDNVMMDSGNTYSPRENVVQSDVRVRYAAGPSDSQRTCESTCGREGLNCTKECRLKKQTEDFRLGERTNFHRTEGDNKYQIPGPLPINKNTEPDIPINKHYRDSMVIQREHLRSSQLNLLKSNIEQQKIDRNRQSQNFYQRGYNKRFQENSPFIKEESPPTIRSLRDPPPSPTLHENVRFREEEDPPMNYTQNIFPKQPIQSIANTNARYATETQGSPQTPFTDRTQISDNPNIRPDVNAQPYPYVGVTNAQNVPKSELEDSVGMSRNPQNADNTTVNTGLTAKNCMCPTAKNRATDCVCGRLEYTTNMMQPYIVPKRLPYYENRDQVPDTLKSNAENALLSNAQQYDQNPQNRNNENTLNFDIKNTENTNNMIDGTKQMPKKLVLTQTLENKNESPKPTIQELMGNYKEGSARRKHENDKSLQSSTPFFDAGTGFQPKKAELSENLNYKNVKSGLDSEKSDIKPGKHAKTSREIAMYEANKIQSDNQSNKDVKSEHQNDDLKIIDYDDLRKSRYDKCETNFDEKNIGDLNIASKVPSSSRDGNIIGKRPEMSAVGQITNVDKTQHDNQLQERYGDDISENRYTQRFPSNEVNDINNAQRIKRRENLIENSIKNESRERHLKDFSNSSPDAHRPTPIATSSPHGSAPKTDKATGNQLGTQLSSGDGDKEKEQLTYSINSSAIVVEEKNKKENKCSRASSPDNTDKEISSMTDLPSEKETATSPMKCVKLCPGRDKNTTISDSAGLPTTSTPMSTAYSLSEGEMPQYNAKSEYRNYSVYMNPEPIEAKQERVEKSTSDNVSKALATISEELARCRLLLEKPREVPTVRLKDLRENEEKKDMPGKMSDSTSDDAIALRRSEAKPHISNGPNTPHVLFTLHIGTVVLSDEAVINSRNLSLVLTWKFYDQNVAMSHMRPGRVIHFDFSTEYDLKLSNEFLKYMKNEELQIKVCEVNKLDAPLASCSLPLREPLLHTNKRADMSLALVAGPRMQRVAPAVDPLDTRDEMGVLDLWCMLRAEPRIVPFINQVISKSRPSRVSPYPNRITSNGTNPLVMQLDDEQSEVRLTNDLDATYLTNQNNGPPPLNNPKNNQKMFDRGFHASGNTNMGQNNNPSDNYGYNINPSYASIQTTRFTPTPVRQVSISKAPPDTLSIRSTGTTADFFVHEPLMSSKRYYDDKTSLRERENARRTSSGFFINEVPTTVKSDEEMKQAVKERTAGLRNRVNNNPTLQDKYDQAQAESKPQRRLSYEQLSIISLRDPKKSTGIKDQDSKKMPGDLDSINRNWKKSDNPWPKRYMDTETPTRERKASYTTAAESRFEGAKMAIEALKSVKTKQERNTSFALRDFPNSQENADTQPEAKSRTVDIAILWLALNEECAAMNDPNVQRLYVAYNFLGRGGAELETPVSLPKPKQYSDKCYFNFKKSFQLTGTDFEMLGRMARFRSSDKGTSSPNDCVVFTVVSEPVEDPLGINNCEDIGTAQLFFGDLLVFSAGSDTYTEVIPIRSSRDDNTICGVLSVRYATPVEFLPECSSPQKTAKS